MTPPIPNDEQHPPHPDLILCEQPGLCNICGENLTRWRAKTFDIHICCSDCFSEGTTILQHLKPMDNLEPGDHATRK